MLKDIILVNFKKKNYFSLLYIWFNFNSTLSHWLLCGILRMEVTSNVLSEDWSITWIVLGLELWL